MVNPKFNGIRWRAPRQTYAPSITPDPDMFDLFMDDTSGLPAIYTELAGTIINRNQRLEIANVTSPNDSGGFSIDVNTSDGNLCSHLEIFASLRSTVAATFDNLYLFFNNDTTVANYRNSYVTANEASANPSAAGAATPFINFVCAANSPTNEFSMCRIFIPFFNVSSPTMVKHALTFCSYSTASSSIGLTAANVRWTTTAITNIRLRPDGYSTDTFNTNSKVTVIGYRS